MLRTASRIAAALLITACFNTASAQYMFRWVDRDGGVHYSDKPPPADARSGEQKTLQENVIDSSDVPYAIRNAAEKFPVTLYSAASCTDLCATAREFLKRRHIPFAERVVVTKEDADALVAVIGGSEPVVPSIAVGRRAAKGYSEAEWNAALDAAGYPKTIP